MPHEISLGVPNNEANVAAVTAERTRLALAVVHLFKTDLTPDEDTDEATFDANEADFDGYAAVTLPAWAAVAEDQDGGSVALNIGGVFAQNGVVTTNEIGGLYVKTAAGDMVEFFSLDLPISFTEVGRQLAFRYTIRRPGPNEMDTES